MIDVNVSAQIDPKVAERAMLKHPFYQAWTEGRLSLDTLRAYARQYFHHVEGVPAGAVSAVHSACRTVRAAACSPRTSPRKEGIESGKLDHTTLWLMFACGLARDGEGIRCRTSIRRPQR